MHVRKLLESGEEPPKPIRANIFKASTNSWVHCFFVNSQTAKPFDSQITETQQTPSTRNNKDNYTKSHHNEIIPNQY